MKAGLNSVLLPGRRMPRNLTAYSLKRIKETESSGADRQHTDESARVVVDVTVDFVSVQYRTTRYQ